jgi:hypothetical protein
MLPDGLTYVASWVKVNGNRCFQLMGCDDIQLFEQWVARWNDLVDFEIVAVRTSGEAAAGHKSAVNSPEECAGPGQQGSKTAYEVVKGNTDG